MEFNYIKEIIEETEEILTNNYNASGISESVQKLFEDILVHLMEGKTIVSKVLAIEETSNTFIAEKAELQERELEIRQGFNGWIAGNDIVEKQLFRRFYNNLQQHIRHCIFKINKFDKLKTLAQLHLEEMGVYLNDFKNLLKLFVAAAAENDQGTISTQEIPNYPGMHMARTVNAIKYASDEGLKMLPLIARVQNKLNLVQYTITDPQNPEKVEECLNLISASLEEEGHRVIRI